MLDLETLDQKRRVIEDRLKEIPVRREKITADIARLDRELKEKEQAAASKEKSLSSHELDLKTSQTQEGEKKLKLNTVKTQKEYDAIKAEIDMGAANRSSLEEKMLLLMDEITELKDLLKREKVSADARKKELNAELAVINSEESSLQTELKTFDENTKSQIEKLPGDTHREYTHLRRLFPSGQILSKLVQEEDNTFSCSACNAPVGHQVVINMKRGQALHHCEICRRLLYTA